MTDRNKFPMIFYTEEQLDAYFLDRLKQLCMEHDFEEGNCQDFDMSGAVIYGFACTQIGIEYDKGEGKYREEIEEAWRASEESNIVPKIMDDVIRLRNIVGFVHDGSDSVRGSVISIEEPFAYVKMFDGVFKVLLSELKKVAE